LNMGREVKRVALDFDWPMDKVWDGFLNPHYSECKACGGSGSTIASKRLTDLVSLLLISGDDARRGKCHPYFYDAPLHNTAGDVVCGKDMTELTTGLAGRAPSFMGHDACDRWSAAKKIIAAAGLPETWGVCAECKGEGQDPSKKADYDAWTRTEPPTGDGWQIWETVSEGSPISPVFARPEELARWMAGKRWGADHGSSYESWLKFITGPGWAPSMIMDSSGIHTGPEAAL
jgi:hypothetical protein